MPPRTPWLLRWLILGASGLVVSIVGFAYGVVMVGVPYQDPTPEMARREAFHLTVSGWSMAIGGWLVLLAIIAALVAMALRIATRRRM